MASVDKEKLVETLKRFRADFPTYAEQCLKIRTKEGALLPLVMNSAQLLLHREIEEQKRRTGKVRRLVLKGRQQGASTYICGRYYRRASMNKYVNVYILAHEQAASDSLFSMVDRYHRNNPIAPHTGKANSKELVFDFLDSSYVVGTAGSAEGGRSRSMTLFHGSEVAFWKNAAAHFASSVQTVPDMAGTEILLESTANGVTGEYYDRCHRAMAGIGDYEMTFIPWFWQSEYARPVDETFRLSDASEDGEISETKYAQMFGLSDAQMAWRRTKVIDFGSVSKFDQEYPATPLHAFQASDTEAYIKSDVVLRARKRKGVASGPLIIGVDPAGPGGDRFAIAFRRGYTCEKIEWRDKIGSPEAVEWLHEVIQQHKPARVFIDAGGIGQAVIGFLRMKNSKYVDVVRAVNFGGTSQAKMANPEMAGPKNRRAEMWQRMHDWLKLEEGVSIPDLDVLQSDLTSTNVKPTLTNDLLLESKQEMRRRGVCSPDLADALALTFADSSHIADFVDAQKKVTYGSSSSVSGAAHRGGRNGWMGA